MMTLVFLLGFMAVGSLTVYTLKYLNSPVLALQSLQGETAQWRLRLWLLLLINSLISLAITLHVGGGFNTTIGWILRVLKFSPSDDSWLPMSIAIEHMREHPDVSVYSEIFFREHIKFQYPVTSLVLFDLLQRFSHASWPTVYRVFDVVSLICLPAIGLVSYRLLKGSEEKEQVPELMAHDHLLLMLSMLSVLFFYPLVHSYVLGQIQTLITFLVAAALLAWQYHRKRLAGLLFGICCAMKPQWMVVVLWGCVRKQWGFSAACACTFGIFSFIAVLLYGVHNLTDYFSVLSYISHHGESYSPNQSINGLVNRFMFNGNNLNWDKDNFAPYHPVVYMLTMLSGAVMIGAAVFWRARKQPTPLDLALMTLSLTMASPIAWKHHYAVIFPILALVAPLALSRRPWGRYTGAYLCLSFILVGQQLDELVKITSTSHWNVLQSYLFWGGMMTLVLLFQLTSDRETSRSTRSWAYLKASFRNHAQKGQKPKSMARQYP